MLTEFFVYLAIKVLPTVVFLTVIVFLARFYFRRSLWGEIGIPEVPSLPLFGNLITTIFRKKAHFQLLEDLYKVYPNKPYIGIYNLTTPVLVIKDVDLLEKMLRDDASNFEDHGLYADASDPFSLNLFYLKGQPWKWTRSKLRSSFATPSLKLSYPRMQRVVEEFVENMEKTVDARNAMNEFACEVIAKVVFSVDQTTGFIENSEKAFDLKGLGALRVLLRMFQPKLAISLGVKLVPQEVEDFFRNAVYSSKREPGSFIDLLLRIKENEPNFTDDMMVAQVFIFVLAGFETTSTALTFALYFLAKHPEVQEKAIEEVDRVISKSGVSFDSVKDMIYLEHVVNETLRMYSPISGITRISENSYKLPCGAVIPMGTSVLFPYMSLHRDPRYFEDPLSFRPERWEKPQRVFYPFGYGPRTCLGMKFAMLEIKVMLSTFLQKYRVKINPRTPESLKFDAASFFIVPDPPIVIDLEDRNTHKMYI